MKNINPSLRLVTALFLLFICFHTYSQKAQTIKPLTHEQHMELNGNYLKERALNNLHHLVKDSSLLDQVVIDDKGIQILNPDLKSHSITMYWEEAPGLIAAFENSHPFDLENMIRSKVHHQPDPALVYNYKFNHYINLPTDIQNLRVAIDPGHFGGTLEEAQREARFVSMSGLDIGTKEDIKFFEADLTYATSAIIKKLLEAAGVGEVMLTRPQGAGAMGKSFSAWMKASYFYSGDIQGSLTRQEISQARANQYTAALKDTTKESNRALLFEYYKYLDFRERVIKINQFGADVTISIHYNASDDAQPSGPKKQVKPTPGNYNMAFVPGAFMGGELAKIDQHIDFLRLLLSPELELSTSLSHSILKKQEEILKVPRYTIPAGSKMTNSTVLTKYEGVYGRNLYLLRAARTAISYTESFYQNNKEEALLLSKKDYTFNDGRKDIVTSSRVKQNAEAIYRGIISWLAENKLKSSIVRK